MGLYASNGMICTQCEAMGFRRITFHPDHPDVLSRYRVRLAGDRARFPILLSNGNCIASGEGEDGTHCELWEEDWKSAVSDKSVAVRVDLACSRTIKNNTLLSPLVNSRTNITTA